MASELVPGASSCWSTSGAFGARLPPDAGLEVRGRTLERTTDDALVGTELVEDSGVDTDGRS